MSGANSTTRPTAPGLRFGLLALCAAYALIYGGLAWQRFATFHCGVDMTYYLRLVWGLAHGHYDLPLVGATSILGLHLEPILLPFAALHWLGLPLAPLLLAVQSVAVALLAVPAYRLADRHLGGPVAGLLGAALALLYPTITVATLHDFHPVTLALPALLGVIDALDEGKHRRALILGAVALACREDIALQLACLTAWESSRTTGAARARTLGITLLLILYFCIYVFGVQPRFVPAVGSFSLHFTLGGRAEVRSGLDLLIMAATRPRAMLAALATWDRLLYLPALLAPYCFLGLLSPRFLIGALPIVGINLLSDFPRVRSIEAHYATAIAPFVIGASLAGAGALLRYAKRRQPALAHVVARLALAGALVLSCAAVHVFHGGSPLAVYSHKWMNQSFTDPPNAAAIRAALEEVPPSVSVAAPVGVLAHLAERPRALSPPTYTDGAPVDYVFPLAPARPKPSDTQQVRP